MANITNLPDFLTDVANAIRNKKNTTSPIYPENFDTEIESIPTSGTEVDFKISSWAYLFYNNYRLDMLDFVKQNTENLNTMSYGFYASTKLENLDLSTIDMTNVMDITNSFQNCSNLLSLNLGNLGNKLTTINNILNGCKKLIDLDMSNMDLSNIKNIYNTFNNCNSLENLKFGTEFGKSFTQKTQYYNQYTITIQSTKLSYNSAMSIINNVYDLHLTYNMPGDALIYRQKINFSAETKSKLSEEDKQIAINKGWDLG